ncbi:chromosome partitioning protein ParA [Arthrobacter echini]|uniref:Chromosome partitioning protein ParA n=1 Tax=Arthrobacter echini TaxID=1529066 RepID=A0A5D0XJI1_9MICC|nr:chromosome partitioning protein ParA [Arthrobacter echini]
MNKALVQAVPVINAIINTDNTGVLTIDAREETFQAETVAQLRSQLMARVIAEAGECERPVRVSTMDESGLSGLLVSPDGDVEQEEPQAQEPRDQPMLAVPAGAAGAATVPAPAQAPAPTAPAVRALAPAPVEAPATVPAAAEAPASRRELREAESFLRTQEARSAATHGVRGWLSRVGIRTHPSAKELLERVDAQLVSQHWAGTRTVMVVNRKGGANKTPTVMNLAAVFGRHGGGGVLAYDGNPEVGTLGWRAEQGPHTATALDVLENSGHLLSTSAVYGDVSGYVHHQRADTFDVLRSDDSLVGTHVMTGDDVDLIHQVAAKYYRLIIMDSGNVDRGSDWARMIQHTDQLVVPTTEMEDRAEAALLTLRGLQERDEHAARLAENAVVIVSQSEPGNTSSTQRIADGFRPFVRAVCTVPYDPALKAGLIVHDDLDSRTRRAWLRAGAEVAQGL